MLMYLIASIVSLDHLDKVLPAKFLHCEAKISSLFFFYFNKGNRSERYRLYFLFSPSTPPALQAVGERDLGSRHQGAHRSCSLLVLQLKTCRLQELTPCHAPPTPTAPYHAKVLWRTQKFLTALFEAKLPTVALRRWSV